MMSIMPRPVDTHVSVQLYKNIQQCFRDIREAAAHSDEEVIQGRIADNGGLLGRVEAVMTILDSRLRRNWHQLALVDEEGGSRRTFQQEIWSEVVRWQSGENPLSIGEINFVSTRILELMSRGEQAYDRHDLDRRGIAQAAWLRQSITRAQLRQAHAHLQHYLNLPDDAPSGNALEGHHGTLDAPFSPQPAHTPRHSTPSTSYLSSTTASSLSPSPSRSPSHSSHSAQLVHPSDLVLHEPRNDAPQVLRRSPRPRLEHTTHSPLPPHEPYTDWQGHHEGTIGHQSYFDEAFHGFDPSMSPHDSPISYGFHSLGRHSHKLTRMRP